MFSLRPPAFRIWAKGGSRNISSGNNAFFGSILLPKTRFPLRSDPAKDEAIARRTTEHLYEWQWENAKGPLFVFHDGPPYANGDLHMGHALNKILKDIINRYHVSVGERVHYVPGWDCHGLPIEQKVLKALRKDVDEVSSVTIRQEAEKYAKEQVESQKDQFKSLGIMAKWDRETTYRTMDHDYEMRQLRIFQKMVERGLIFRQHRPVHYSPSSQSALAESELEYKDAHVSHSVYVTFDLESTTTGALSGVEGPIRLLVWTTTPWTLTANMGIAVSPEMQYVVGCSSQDPEAGALIFALDRKEDLQPILDGMGIDEIKITIPGSALVELKYRSLFSSRNDAPQSLSILPSSHVTPDSGTGVVHLAPAHGQEDYELFRSRGLTSDMVCHVDRRGRFTSSVITVVGEAFAGRLIGKEVLSEGGKAMVDILTELQVLKKIQRYKHRYPYDWKTDQPIIMMATSQWFANLDAIKGDAINALQEVDFFPAVSRNRLEAFVRSRSEWCISRQRVWGVPIPALYHLPTESAILTPDSLTHIISVLERKGTRRWWNGSVADFVPPSLLFPGEDVDKTWVKGTDTMDVWFDSGTSWSLLEGLAQVETSQKVPGRYADVCLEGSDQHRGWFQSLLLTAVASAPLKKPPVAPYGALITHGMVLDENDRKMSKSIGNIVTPQTIIHGGKDTKKEPAYGTGVLRLWVATVEVGRDMSIGPTVLSQCVENLRKIRNTARFLLGNLGDHRLSDEDKAPRELLGMTDRYVMHKLHELESTAREGYSTYNFPKVVAALSNFANITLSTLYFDTTKDPLYCDAKDSVRRRAIVTVMEQLLDTITKVMAPILPHLAEEIHQTRYPEGTEVSSVFCQPWQPLDAEWHDPQVESDMIELLRLKDFVNILLEKPRRNKELRSSLMADVDIVIPDRSAESSRIQLFIVSQVNVVDDSSLSVSKTERVPPASVDTSDDFTIMIDEGLLGALKPVWAYTHSLEIPGSRDRIIVRVRSANSHKCPRCWTYTAEEEGTLCGRCSEVLHL
ncbi:uncharacterized protein PHACADRAFT_208201 [Phanerochaete carnosa HHB-10118-sp]|uniref:Isoleucine--tRNA ligase, mitochondrial n=1 Tax=Phanerochaete carnosa (strain HHB-10118-sp) TaxID=650164 RepID=K5X2L7_PHACS|nr:uncharacterized protein PHACADRAFT_208201 [Phanerochaete carnosa HHB-10118-sp]EKM57047.1 hypothetical protein PHACADRAFT_208201 [Phanerochaete carnosa HHB-10118-sp]